MVLSMERWKCKVAIVTGVSSGIGAAIAEKLVEEGLLVAGFARRVENIEELSNELKNKKGKLYAVKVDITKEEQILNGFKWVEDNLGFVSILVNGAGLAPITTLTDGDTKLWRDTFNTNVLGLCVCTREAVKIMKREVIDGHIIHINSIAGHLVPRFPKIHVYPASKHAVTALNETLSEELNHLGLKIKTTSISPGAVNTEMIQTLGWNIDYKSILQAEDIADAVVYALSTPPHVQVHEMIIKPMGAKY